MSVCPRCGEPGPHYVPPSFGDTGFFSCDPSDGPQPSRTPENYMGFRCVVCDRDITPGILGGPAWEIRPGGFAHLDCSEEAS